MEMFCSESFKTVNACGFLFPEILHKQQDPQFRYYLFIRVSLFLCENGELEIPSMREYFE